MKPRVKLIVATHIALATVLGIVAVVNQKHLYPEHVLLWVVLCMVSELFWVKTPTGDTVHSLAATAKLSAVFIFDIWTATLIVFTSTVIGNFVFRRAMWYRALYNGSQLMLAAASAAVLYRVLGGHCLLESLALPSGLRIEAVVHTLSTPTFFTAISVAGAAYILANNSSIVLLMNAMTGRRLSVLWRENLLYPEEILSSLASILLAPLLVLLYGSLGVLGLVLLFACLSLVHQANRRYLDVIRAQDNLIRSERMTAMGEMAEEIGRSLGKSLGELKLRAGRLYQLARKGQSDPVLKSAQIVEVNVDHMSALVDGLAAFSHHESQPVPTDLNELLRRTMDFVKPQNRFDNIHFKLTPDPILPVVNVDPSQMQQVFINLLTNAADALGEVDRPVRKIFVETHFDPNVQRIRISFSDNGPGIPDANLDRIFEPHFTTKATGHGFGLATVFRIAANHKGCIQAANLPGGGARFLVDLPNS